MPKTNCNIIKDLLPSYIDEVCSTDSKQCIEEHFNECENCKKIYEQSKSEILHVTSLNEAELDYFKKIKNTMSRKNLVLMIAAILLFLVTLYYNTYCLYSNPLNYSFPLLMGGLLFTILPDYTENTVPLKWKLGVLGGELAAVTLNFLLLFYAGYSISNKGMPFGINPEHLGPCLALVSYLLLLGMIITFILSLLLGIKKRCIYPAMIFVPLGGIAFIFECIFYLHEFDMSFILTHITVPMILFAVQVVLLIGVYAFVNRKNAI